MLSIIIPTYNASLTVNKVLTALYNQKGIDKADYEVLIVDDCSQDNTVDLVREFPVRVITSDQNLGPAAVRNRGAREAKGELILFIDSDVILKEDALIKVKERFLQHPDIAGLIGIYAKQPANPGLFREYLALRKYSNWFDPQRKFISLWIVSIGAIKKGIFMEFGGFDTRYRGADVEDLELGYRIAEKYKIILADEIQGHHNFPNFTKTVRNFFKRSFQWIELFFKRKRFSTEAATTKKRAIANFAGFASFISLLLGIWYQPLWIAGILAILVFIIASKKFYIFVLQEKGILFLIYALMLDYIFAVVIGWAAMLSVLNQCRFRVTHR